MPLIVVVGVPSSGKTTWVLKAAEFFRNQKQKTVHVVREEDAFDGNDKNQILNDSRREKELRARVKSSALRVLNKEDIVIVDALNYIKGYRYELYCMSKNVPTSQVTVYCEIEPKLAFAWNLIRPDEEQYTRDVFDNLLLRFEHPDPKNRWDSPCFTVIPNEDFDFNPLFVALFLTNSPKPNQSTQNKPVSETSYLSSMEKVTSDIIQAVIESQKKEEAASELEELTVPHSSQTVKLNEDGLTVNLAQLTRYKRQFISLSKAGRAEPKGDVGDMFVQYLNSQFKQQD